MPTGRTGHRRWYIIADSSAHDKQVELVVYKLSVENQQFTSSRGYQYRLGNVSDRVRPQHYILLLLGEQGAKSTYEILESFKASGYNYYHSRQISSKLQLLKQQGLIAKDAGNKWRLTSLGEKVYNSLKEEYLNLAKGSEKIRTILENIGIYKTDTVRVSKSHLDTVRILSEILDKIKETTMISKDEEELLKIVLENYLLNRKGYTYADILVEDYGYNINELKRLVKRLQVKDLMYIFRDRMLGTRIGLSDRAKAIADQVLSSSSSYANVEPMRREALKHSESKPSIREENGSPAEKEERTIKAEAKAGNPRPMAMGGMGRKSL